MSNICKLAYIFTSIVYFSQLLTSAQSTSLVRGGHFYVPNRMKFSAMEDMLVNAINALETNSSDHALDHLFKIDIFTLGIILKEMKKIRENPPRFWYSRQG